MSDNLELLTSIVPAERQINWQELGYYNFIHFGMNSITGREWGDGKDSPSIFNPKNLDTDEWAHILKASGSKGVILTAKHHDGFCLFPSKFTDYSIASSPYKDGKGDIVGDMAKSCRKYGLKFGVYLSPWDRHEKTYGTDEYNTYYCNQLRELCKNYGELFEVWLDGACGEGPNGKVQKYDFESYYKIIRHYQPNAVIAISGPDVRWIGNEGGKTRENEWSVVPAELANQAIPKEERKFDCMDNDLGSRKVLEGVTDLTWFPAECDVSLLRKGWFYSTRKALFGGLLSLKKLKSIYYNTVGANAALLLNVPPDKNGTIPKSMAKRLAKFGEAIASELKNPQKCRISPAKTSAEGLYYFEINSKATAARKIEIREDVTHGQRIEKWELQYKTTGGVYYTYAKGGAIGFRTIIDVPPFAAAERRLIVTETRGEPYLDAVIIYS